MDRVHKTLKDVADHPVSLTGALTWAIGVFFWTGDLQTAETSTEKQNTAVRPRASDKHSRLPSIWSAGVVRCRNKVGRPVGGNPGHHVNVSNDHFARGVKERDVV